MYFYQKFFEDISIDTIYFFMEGGVNQSLSYQWIHISEVRTTAAAACSPEARASNHGFMIFE